MLFRSVTKFQRFSEQKTGFYSRRFLKPAEPSLFENKQDLSSKWMIVDSGVSYLSLVQLLIDYRLKKISLLLSRSLLSTEWI